MCSPLASQREIWYGATVQPTSSASEVSRAASAALVNFWLAPLAASSPPRAARNAADVVEVALRVDDQERRPLVLAELPVEKFEHEVGVIRRADAGVDQDDEERRGDDVEEWVLIEAVL